MIKLRKNHTTAWIFEVLLNVISVTGCSICIPSSIASGSKGLHNKKEKRKFLSCKFLSWKEQKYKMIDLIVQSQTPPTDLYVKNFLGREEMEESPKTWEVTFRKKHIHCFRKPCTPYYTHCSN